MIRPGDFAVVGAAESTKIGTVPELSSFGLALDSAINALNDAGLSAAQIDGVTSGYLPPSDLAYALGIKPTWADSTIVGGCSWMFQLRNAIAAIQAGYCETVLICYGESGRSHQLSPNVYDIGAPGSIGQQFDIPFAGEAMQASLFSLPLVRYMETYNVSEESIATIPVAQRRWASLNPRASKQDPISVDDVLNSPVITWPVRRLMCCQVSDAGGSIIVCKADRAADFPKPPVYILGTGGAIEAGIVSPAGVDDPLHPSVARRSAETALRNAKLQAGDIDHLMIYDAFAHNPIFGIEGIGLAEPGCGAEVFASGATSPGGALPVNTNGGGLSYAHSGSYGMLCMLESIRQIRGEAAAQVDGVETSLAHGWGGFWSAAATIIFGSSVVT